MCDQHSDRDATIHTHLGIQTAVVIATGMPYWLLLAGLGTLKQMPTNNDLQRRVSWSIITAGPRRRAIAKFKYLPGSISLLCRLK